MLRSLLFELAAKRGKPPTILSSANNQRTEPLFNQVGDWTARKRETPTATGWSDAMLRLALAQARVFDDQLRSLAAKLRNLAGESI